MNNNPNFSKTRRVGIIGGNFPDMISKKQAYHMGKLIAQSGYILVNGGMGGVMEESARGAKSAGGMVIGILPGQNFKDGNSYTDIVIPTGLGYQRNPIVVLNSDILVAIDGSYGTLSEIAYTQIFKKTVLGLNTWNIPGVIHCDNPEQIIKKINQYFEN